MRLRISYNPTVVAIAIGVIVVSTVTMSVVSYRYTVGRENLTETSLVQTNTKLASGTVDRIEQKIIDNDRILSDMVDVNEPSRWPEMVEAIKKADLNVEQVYFVRADKYHLLYPPWSEVKHSWGVLSPALRELDVVNLAVNQTHHLHKERSDNYLFVSYVAKENDRGDKILVCFQMNHNRIIELLDRYLRDLETSLYVSIVDFENNGVYKELPYQYQSGKYFHETRFPTTLYKWILQVVPRNFTELEESVRNQRRTDLSFMVLSVSLIFVSLGIIYAASRRERQLRQLKEDFISNVSHELKTPLSLIRMFSEILATGRVKGEKAKQDYYDIIHTESDRMTHLVNNLLDFASLERKGARLHFERTNIAELVTKDLEAYRYQTQKEGFQVAADVDPGIPDTMADPNAITMAFFNLLDNSVKYSSDQRQIQVRVRQTNGYVDLSVIDRGMGVPEGEQQKIFEKFYRGTNARKIRGSGIGLSIIEHVAEMHGGDVVVQSEPGKGSTFTLRIPVRKPPDPE